MNYVRNEICKFRRLYKNFIIFFPESYTHILAIICCFVYIIDFRYIGKRIFPTHNLDNLTLQPKAMHTNSRIYGGIYMRTSFPPA